MFYSNNTLFVVNGKCTFDKQLALAYGNALKEWSTSADIAILSMGASQFINYEYLESYLTSKCFTWLYSYVQAWYQLDLSDCRWFNFHRTVTEEH